MCYHTVGIEVELFITELILMYIILTNYIYNMHIFSMLHESIPITKVMDF